LTSFRTACGYEQQGIRAKCQPSGQIETRSLLMIEENNILTVPMPGFIPFAGKNAIAEMTIGVQFALPFDLKIAEREEAVKAAFHDDFPKYEPMQAVTINLGPAPFQGLNPNAGSIAGFSFTRTKADGTSPARILRVMSNTVSAQFMEYTRWAEIKPQAVGYIVKCLEKAALMEQNRVVSIVLRYQDRFTFDGQIQDATAGALFRKDTQYLVPEIFNSGYRWHSYSGWFQPLVGDFEGLNNLNIASAPVQSKLGVTIEHTNTCSLKTPYNTLEELVQGVPNRSSFAEVLESQHDTNANILIHLLSDDILKIIGLKR
jgi:uncharacterized protein (TIGR04255 family)